MLDELKKFLQRELDEIKQNKFRAIGIAACFIVALIFWIVDDSFGGEEIILDEPTPIVDAPPATKDFPVVSLPEEKSSEGVTLVLGANADPIFIGDPFVGAEKPKPLPQPPPKITMPPAPPIVIQPPQISEQLKPQEKFILTGTAISGANKIAMFLRGKETLFLTIGEEIGGKKISDITPDFVTFADGEVLTIRN